MSRIRLIAWNSKSTDGGEICAQVDPKGRSDFGSLFGFAVLRRRTGAMKIRATPKQRTKSRNTDWDFEALRLCRNVAVSAAGDKARAVSALPLPMLPQLAHGLDVMTSPGEGGKRGSTLSR